MASENKAALPSNKSGIIFGLITGGAIVGYSFLMKFINAPEQSPVHFIAHLLFLLGVLWFIHSYSKEAGHDSTFKGLFKAGFRMVAIVTIVMLITTLLMLYMDPSIKEKSLQGYFEELQRLKKSPAEIKTDMAAAREHFVTSQVMSVLYLYIFEGVLFTLAGAALFKKNIN
jgi:hypothetical protein